MVQSTSWVAASSSRILRNQKVNHCDHKSLQLVPQPSQMNPISVWSTLKLSFQLDLRVPHDLFLQFFPTNHCMHFSTAPYVPHVQPLSSCLILSPEYYLVRCTNSEVPHHAIFASILLLTAFIESVQTARHTEILQSSCCTTVVICTTVVFCTTVVLYSNKQFDSCSYKLHVSLI